MSSFMKETQTCLWSTGLFKFSAPHERQERRDAREHRQRILVVAQELFTEHGVEAVSMHQIARAAGIGQGTLYRRYAHKGELCVDLLYEHHQQFVDEITDLLTTKAASPALERLESVLERIVAFLEDQSALLGPISLREIQQDCHKDEADYFQPFSWLHELCANLLTEAVTRKELVALDISYTVDALLAALCPMVYRFQRQERGFSPERILQGLCRLYIDGIRTPRAKD
jgi:AcrR family transcriptional regulator